MSFVVAFIVPIIPVLLANMPSFSMLIRKCTVLKVAKSATQTPIRAFECPYDYLLHLYGPHHFKKIIAFLRPDLETDDPALFSLVLEVLDAVHFGAILVDDVTDNSKLRKGHLAAHHIYGSSETVNRAYLVILNIITKCQRERPELVPFILDCITEIHQGQDDSLVWRRDGFPLPKNLDEALDRYRRCARMKTGAMFKLVGQLITCSNKLDNSMNDYGWYCQLQNDCKNVFSSDVVTAKGALAEDLINGEYTYPILVGLYADEQIKNSIADAFDRRRQGKAESEDVLHRAVLALQSEEVRIVCLQHLEDARQRNQYFSVLWGRQERMSLSTSF